MPVIGAPGRAVRGHDRDGGRVIGDGVVLATGVDKRGDRWSHRASVPSVPTIGRTVTASGPWVTVAVSLNVTGAPFDALKLTVTGIVVDPEANVTGTG